MLKNVLIHLRIPFSVFLLPVYLFAVSQTAIVDQWKALWVFILIHLFLYPASNGYNSYYDQDEGSIGLIRTPPPATISLYYTVWGLDILALVIAWYVGLGKPFLVYLLVYGLVSKAYSYPGVRLKKYPVVSWLTVGFFQGAFTYTAVILCLNPALSLPDVLNWKVAIPALISMVNLLAVYPLTQIYQHADDARNGDMTFSRLVGVNGTFVSGAVCFALSGIGYAVYFLGKEEPVKLAVLAACMAPALIFFQIWWWKTRKDPTQANFNNTMIMNLIASLCLNLFFGILIWMS